jgi:NAD(P)-dependent dehydrogenase (short-subunit alcohol dehydrogenase family)
VKVDTYDSLDGQVVLVTGANRGIGERIAAKLADAGATVYAGARRPGEVTAADQRPVELDVTDDGEMRTAVDRIADETGRLDVLVNNAGVRGPTGPLHDAPVDGIDRTFAVNLRGPTVLTKFALPLLRERDGGRVVNLASGLGALAPGMDGGSPPYRVSKTGLNGLTAYLHGEYGEEGLIANSTRPGWVETDLATPGAPRTPAEGADTPAWLARFEPGAPGGRCWRDRTPIGW